MMTAIPKHFGAGGSGLTPDGSSGHPCLRDILEEHRAGIEGGGEGGPNRGTGTLVAGVLTVTDVTLAAGSVIFATRIAPGAGAITGSAGFKIANRTDGAVGVATFDIVSIDDAKATILTDNSTVAWRIEG